MLRVQESGQVRQATVKISVCSTLEFLDNRFLTSYINYFLNWIKNDSLLLKFNIQNKGVITDDVDKKNRKNL